MKTTPLLIGLIACAAQARDLPDFDAFAAPRSPTLEAPRADDAHLSHLEPRLGVPTFVWADRNAPHHWEPNLTAEQVARRELAAHAALYRTDPVTLATSSLVNVHDTGEGAIIVTFERRLGGVPLFRDRLHVLLTRQLELVALTGYLSPRPPKGAPKLTAATAASVAWQDLSGAPLDPAAIREGAPGEGGYLALALGAERAGPARARQVFFGLADHLEPAWYLELTAGGDSTDADLVGYVISAVDGALLFRRNLTDADVYSYRVWADTATPYLPWDGPQGTDPSPHPTGVPNGYYPPMLAPPLVALQNGPISTNDPWLPAGATETTGNNAEAYADITSPDGFNAGDVRATPTGAATFDRVYDVTLPPDASSAQRQAAITQLFYDVNFLHDWFYDKGFDEAAGNAQTSNFSRGGLANDSLKAEAQDSSGMNNANMSTPSDGQRPRMQMYLWDSLSAPGLTVTAGGSGTYVGGPATFGPQTFTLSGTLVLAVDGTAPTSDACQALTNTVTGRIVLVDRGTCTYVSKVLAAQAAGAIGVIIADSTGATTPPPLPGTDSTITIPALSVTTAAGTALKALLAAGAVTVQLSKPPGVNRDGSVDNTIVAHEWGHYLSNRLIADAAGLSNQQGRGMGEGWSDFVAMLMVVRASDGALAANQSYGGVYALASHVMSGPAGTGGGNEGYYFGIRRFPYSTNFAKNALTFHHIQDGVGLPTGIPMAALGGLNSEVHNAGEVWATMLWDCYASLLRATGRLTFAQAQDRMMRYLVASLKLTPSAPTFLEARDALLAAAAATDPLDYVAFAQAFARRGAGIAAVAPPRTATNDSPVVEDYNTGNDVAFVSATLSDDLAWCDHDGVLDDGERGALRITVKNVGVGNLAATTGTVTSTTPGVTITNGTLSFAATTPYASATAVAEVTLTGATAPTQLDFTVSFTDPALTNPAARTATASFRGNADSLPATSATDTVEAAPGVWTPGHDTALSTQFDWSRKELSPMDHVWFGPDPGGNADVWLVSPPLPVGTGAFSFTLRHRWDFEASGGTNYDGAVIELSADNGLTWTDVGASTSPGYTGALGGTGSNNPLVGRQAFTGRSTGYPAFLTSTVSLGTAYQGRTVLVRFRVGSDQASGGLGWDVDDIAFTGITSTPFGSVVTDRGVCANRPPVANAGPDFAVDELTAATLDPSRSSDPDGNALTFTWAQTAGPAVTLTGNAFTAPAVTADTPLTFQLTAGDGQLTSTDTVVVTVRNVNHPPTASAGAAFVADERSTVTLPGTASDPDGDPLTPAWTQTAGPAVALSDAAALRPTFTAPEVTADTRLTFQLVVSDGTVSTAPSTIEVTVRNVNRAPVANAGPDQTVDEGAQVTLAGSGSDPDGDAVFFVWNQVQGPAVTLLGATSASPTFVAPHGNGDLVLGFELQVSDGSLSSASQTHVTVRHPNRPPVANAGPPQTVARGAKVTLDGSQSSDPDGDPLAFAWTQTAGPGVALTGADGSGPTFAAPQVKEKTTLTFALAVSDGSLSSTATVDVTVDPALGCGCTTGPGTGAVLGGLALLLLRRRRVTR